MLKRDGFCRYVCSLLMFLIFGCGSTLGGDSLNVLMIAVDDLRPELGVYGATHVKSPNIDRLAEGGVVFERAYCQQAVCNPSRTSLMTGLRPDTIGVTGNHVHFRDNRPDVVTLSQHFKINGYHAQSIGKIYHGVFPDGASKTVWDTMGDPESWSVPTTRFGPRYYYTESGMAQAKASYLKSYKPKDPGPNDWEKKLVFGPMTEAPDVTDETLYDGKVAAATVRTLGELKEKEKPFFLAVGFIKPHTPFVAPKKYWDWYEGDEIQLAPNPEYPKGAPSFAGHNSQEVRRYTDQPNKGAFTEANQRNLKHGYYACISYIDAQVGKVLDELDRLGLRENTIVVLFGDHGWHLGEQGLWGKTTNFELDTRAPLIVSAPGMKARGGRSRALVEFVDIYPTLVDLAGLKAPVELEGESFKALLDDPARELKEVAISQYPRGKLMGYSMRTDRWRYTGWIDRTTGVAEFRELYDHENDPSETVNVVGRAEHAREAERLAKNLRTLVDLK
jgi:arylsulfatase A-like enzyme